MGTDFYRKIRKVTLKDTRYKQDAYEFVLDALWFAQKKLKRNGHVNTKELLDGIKEFALDEYGPLAKTVIRSWGIYKTDDFGEIVFNMIEEGLMRKTDTDSLEDFKNVYDFEKAFNVFISRPSAKTAK